MKKLLLSVFTIITLSTNAQTVLFEDSFETYADFIVSGIGNWTNLDVDLRPTYGFEGVTFTNSNAAKAFQIFNSTTTTPPLTPSATSNWSARTGVKAAVCFAAVPNVSVSANNDWLISPQIQLAPSGNTLSFWAKSCDTQYGLEKFRVGVSTTGTAPADFTIISAGNFITNPATAAWVEYTFSLGAYNSQNVYIAINCVSDDQFGFAVDDFKVTTTDLSVNEFAKNNFSLYPNPSKDNFTLDTNSAVMSSIQITDVNGRIVKNINLSGVSNTSVDVTDLTSGMYFVSVETDLGKGTTKIVKN
ncbi:T9SS-dependent choice-of-anchor J family protein [Flavobacterium orientale]|uniref:Por secretion system C-terminal sorting domain-containing protein n=1 Tax=Flavobacterium orientale TaxID=1756020 RepID=A0A917DAX9_9FLAO|nr:choice-of-anchor J domain-containing protein [Flavobacterium orientale]GGD20353.1 hypothetical protein GCM10011343_08610 [Flavobacterium orientale]